MDKNPYHNADIAISSRVRLARNFSDLPFPPMLGEADAERVYNTAAAAIEVNNAQDYRICRLKEIPHLERMRLVEHHRISPALLSKADVSGVILRKDDTVCVMINEEDHLRIQAILPGLSLEECMTLADSVDDAIESRIDYAFDPLLGYLTTCPTNTGTGLRASVMLHLPALTITGQINNIVQAVSKIGLIVRGVYGEGSEASGCLYQLSNQITLGRTEEDILLSLNATAQQVIEAERGTRHQLAQANRLELEDRVMRSLGIFLHARKMNSKEFMGLWSDVRLGVGLGWITDIDDTALIALFEDVQPASLTARAGKELTPPERDALRCQVIKEHAEAVG